MKKLESLFALDAASRFRKQCMSEQKVYLCNNQVQGMAKRMCRTCHMLVKFCLLLEIHLEVLFVAQSGYQCEC